MFHNWHLYSNLTCALQTKLIISMEEFLSCSLMNYYCIFLFPCCSCDSKTKAKDKDSSGKKVPSELRCPSCSNLLTDAVLIPCCGTSYCDDCMYHCLWSWTNASITVKTTTTTFYFYYCRQKTKRIYKNVVITKQYIH